ncbi:MAG: transposase [Polaromonas sp.]|uniref:transposase n=1 Tax=Polaromonas sp. TaxID=1869339 RepID=UPI002735C2A8|nr:transposase [Polaromonas sp.]MDP2819249.1 transposase [Polaromonas sp.]
MRWDIEKVVGRKAFIVKLRRLADALERGERFSIQVLGERIVVPRDATFGVEHEHVDWAKFTSPTSDCEAICMDRHDLHCWADEASPTYELCANAHGFSLHAGVHCAADDRQGLEQLCRYITRPATSQ